MEHSRQLFHSRLFNSEEKCPPHLEEVSCQILEKCAGLPLAIIAISGLLANKDRTKARWDQVKSSIGHGLERHSSIERMRKIISLSYFDLPPHLKTCLLYLSIYPEDYVIDKGDLIRRWIAEGFIHNENGYTLHEAGEICFNELVNRSLIQPVLKSQLFDEVKECRVHDTILDFVVSKSVEENFVTIIGVPGINPDAQNKVRRLSVQNTCEVPAGLVLCNARSLYVFGAGAKIPSFLAFERLRVLGIENGQQLEDRHLADICNLFRMKYLRLRDVKLTMLPAEIAKLHYLETLEIHSTAYKTPVKIPATISGLGQLVHLHVHGCTMPDEIGGMEALQVLEDIVVPLQSTNFLRQLGELTKVTKLRIFIGGFEEVEEICSSICKLVKANLSSLHIFIAMEGYNFLERLSLPAQCSLQELMIEGEEVCSVPRWMGSLVGLQKLSIYTSKREQKYFGIGENECSLKILGSLPDLRYVCLKYRKIFSDMRRATEEDHLELTRAIGANVKDPKFVWMELGEDSALDATELVFQFKRLQLRQKLALRPA
jgi:disease resistance protein RPM1